jgi:hypothetical protein
VANGTFQALSRITSGLPINRPRLLGDAHTFHAPSLVCLLVKGKKGGEPPRPFINSHDFHADQSSTNSFHASREGRTAARPDFVVGCVEDLKGNLINERVSVSTNPDGPRVPVFLYQGPGSTKDEGLGHRAVIVPLCVPPDPRLRREEGGWLAPGMIMVAVPPLATANRPGNVGLNG